MYDRMIENYKTLFDKAEKAKENERNYYEVIKVQKARGISTDIEEKQAELIVSEAEAVSSNYSDMIWYYKWQKSLIK